MLPLTLSHDKGPPNSYRFGSSTVMFLKINSEFTPCRVFVVNSIRSECRYLLRSGGMLGEVMNGFMLSLPGGPGGT